MAFYIDGVFRSDQQLTEGAVQLEQCGGGIAPFCGADHLYAGVSQLGERAFAGEMHSLLVFQAAVTQRDVERAAGPATVVPVPVSVAPQCRCPATAPLLQGTAAVCLPYDRVSSVPRLRTGQTTFYPGYASDGDTATRWQSTTNRTTPHALTFDLRGRHHVVSVAVTFFSLRPRAMVLQVSQDGGGTWIARQYYAENCTSEFGMAAGAPLGSGDAVNCLTLPTDTFVPTGDLIGYAPLASQPARPGQGAFPEDVTVRAFTEATHLRLLMVASPIDPALHGVSYAAYHAVSEVAMETQCACNGHASSCVSPSEGGTGAFACACEHETAGDSCERCRPMYNNVSYATRFDAPDFVCEACECHGHATACAYDPDKGHGVCTACQDNTAGDRCETCTTGYFLRAGASIGDVDACAPCQCGSPGVEAGRAGECASGSGQCACRPNVVGIACDACAPGFFATQLSAGCQPCQCNAAGTVGGGATCDAATGACTCKTNVQGPTCGECAPDAILLDAANPDGCTPCDAECEGGCTGPSNGECTACRHYEETDGTCVAACPVDKYPDDSARCQACRDTCIVVTVDAEVQVYENAPFPTTLTPLQAADREQTRASGNITLTLSSAETLESASLLEGAQLSAQGAARTTGSLAVAGTGLRLTDVPLLDLDGVDGFAAASATAQAQVAASGGVLTLTALLQPQGADGGYVVSRSNADASELSFGLLLSGPSQGDAVGDLRFTYMYTNDRGATFPATVVAPVDVLDGQWHQLMVALDGPRALVVYVDGVEQYRGTPQGSPVFPATHGALFVGQRAPGAHRLRALVQDVRLYPGRALASWPPAVSLPFAVAGDGRSLLVVAGLDRERTAAYRLTIMATDASGQRTGTAHVNVTVLDINDNRPIPAQMYACGHTGCDCSFILHAAYATRQKPSTTPFTSQPLSRVLAFPRSCASFQPRVDMQCCRHPPLHLLQECGGGGGGGRRGEHTGGRCCRLRP